MASKAVRDTFDESVIPQHSPQKPTATNTVRFTVGRSADIATWMTKERGEPFEQIHAVS